MADIDTSHLDADTDKVKPARASLLQTVQRVNDLASTASATKGAGLAAFSRTPVYGASTVGASLRQMAVNVRDHPFNAAGDGTTDDTAAIQAAIDWLSGCGFDGGEVYLPPGSYRITSSLSLDASPVGAIRLVGAGFTPSTGAPETSRIVKAATMTTAGIDMLSPGCTVERLVVEGEPGNTGDGIWMRRDHSTIRDVLVWKAGGHGVRVGTDTATDNVNLWRLDNVWSYMNGSHGFCFTSGTHPTAPNTNAGTATHLHAVLNGGAGMYLRNAAFNTIIGFTAENNTAGGMIFDAGAGSNKIVGGDVAEGNGPWDIEVLADAVCNAFFHVQCQRSRASLGVAGTRSLWIGFNTDSTEPFLIEGPKQISMVNELANDIVANQPTGYLRFMTNGDSPSDANSVLRLRNDGAFVLGKLGGALSKVLTGSAAWTPGAIANGSFAATDVSIGGVEIGDQCVVGYSQPLSGGMVISGHCNVAGTVRVTLHNVTGSSQTPTAGTVRVTVIKQA